MQQYYTLQEAAGRLMLTPDELRELARTKKIRAFQDRGSWRFRSQDIEEEARKRGIGSDPELQYGEASRSPKPAKAKPPSDSEVVSLDMRLDDKGSSKSGRKSPKPKAASDSDVRLVMDSDFEVDPDSDVRLEKSPKPGAKGKTQPTESPVRQDKQPSDSDVKVVPPATDSDVKPNPMKSPSDSDIRLNELTVSRKKTKEDSIVTEEIIDLDAEEAKLSDKPPSSVIRARVKPSGSQPALPTTSPFELSENEFDLDDAPPKKRKSPDKQRADKDSSSDFELVPFDSSKSPLDLGSGEIPLLPSDDEVNLGGGGGLNLQDPADSGISLESGGSDEMEFELTLDSGTTEKAASEDLVTMDDDSSSEFELSLEDDDSPSDPSSSEFELSLDDSGDVIGLSDDSGSDSEFELTLDDEGSLAMGDEGKDIFEPTNFDVPALDDDSGSEAVAIEESDDTDLEGSSDFEISLDDSDSDSESQVVAIDDEEADIDAATVAKPKKAKGKGKVAEPDEDSSDFEVDLDEEVKTPAKKKTKTKKAAAVIEEVDEDDDEDEPRATAPAPPAEWGALPAVMLMPTVIVLFIVSFMGFELIQGAFSYNRPGARTSKLIIDPIAKPIAEAFDAKLPE